MPCELSAQALLRSDHVLYKLSAQALLRSADAGEQRTAPQIELVVDPQAGPRVGAPRAFERWLTGELTGAVARVGPL